MQKVEHEPGSRPDHAMDFLHIFPDTILLYTTYPSVDRYIYIHICIVILCVYCFIYLPIYSSIYLFAQSYAYVFVDLFSLSWYVIYIYRYTHYSIDIHIYIYIQIYTYVYIYLYLNLYSNYIGLNLFKLICFSTYLFYSSG